MNKKLLAVVIGAAIATPAVSLADAPTVYGKINMTLDRMSSDNVGGGTDSQWNLDSNASRLGLKGSSDLTSGLQAIYQIELQTCVDSGDCGGQTLTQRDSFVGLKGGFGTFKAGIFDTPLKKAQGGIDQFNDLKGDMSYYMAGEIRHANALQYSTPKLGDLVTVNVAVFPGEGAQYTANNNSTQTGVADGVSASAVFQNDMVYAALAVNNKVAGDSGVILAKNSLSNIVRGVVQVKPVDNLKIGALYQTVKGVDNDKTEEKSFMASAAYSIQAVTLKLQFGQGKATKDATGASSNAKITQMAVGADYKLGKGTKTFAYYTNFKNEDGANGSTASQSLTDSVFGVGLEHKF